MRANLDLRYYQAFPPIVSAGGAIPHDHVPYQGCGSPMEVCTTDAAPSDVDQLVTKMRGTSLASLGMLAGDTVASPTDPTTARVPAFWTSPIWNVVRLAATGAGAYHGYKRHNGSVGWAIGWALLGGIFWPVSMPVAFAQGFGKPARGR